MRISLFQSERDQSPQTIEVTWQDHVDGLSRCRDVECPTSTLDKQGQTIPVTVCPSLTPASANKCEARKGVAWSPAFGNGQRGDSNVEGMDCIVLDVDHVSMTELARLDAEIERLGWAAILHSTHSHNPPDDVAVRLVFRPSRTLTPAEIVPTRDWVQAQLGMRADEQTKNLERLYFLPSRPKNGPAYLFAAVEGKSIEPVTTAEGKTSFLAGVVARGTTSAPSSPIAAGSVFSGRTNGDIPALRLKLANDRTDLVGRMRKGERLAESGKRDDAIHALAGALAFKMPDASVEAMLEMMRPSLAAMEPPESGDWIPIARDKLERACERFAIAEAEKKERNDIGLAAFRKEAARSKPDPDGGSGPFDAARVEQWALKHGCTPAEFQKQWIIRHHGGNWIFCSGRYESVVPDRDAEVSIRRDLSRAPVQLTIADKEGNPQPRPLRSILFEYATAARRVQASLSLRESYYDARAETFHEAVCPIRHELKAVEHPEIHRWLELFGGEVLLDWVACVTRLEKPAAALYIEGPPGTGKNVLADGLARLWHKGGASAFKNVIGANFNDSLCRCPLIHADEGIPKTDTIIDDLRALIGSNVRDLNRKFMPVVSIEGCPRLIITANNDRVLLDTGAHLGPNDIEAITQRIRQLKADPEAARYLEAIREAKTHGYIEDWIKGDKVAQHALWLTANRKIDETKRFLVSGVDSAQAERMITGTGQVGAVMEFLARYLSDTSAVKTPKIRAGGGKLLVNTEALADRHAWERFVPSRKIPSARLISDSLRAISETAHVTFEGLPFFEVKARMLLNWSQTNQVGSAVMIEARIAANG